MATAKKKETAATFTFARRKLFGELDIDECRKKSGGGGFDFLCTNENGNFDVLNWNHAKRANGKSPDDEKPQSKCFVSSSGATAMCPLMRCKCVHLFTDKYVNVHRVACERAKTHTHILFSSKHRNNKDVQSESKKEESQT